VKESTVSKREEENKIKITNHMGWGFFSSEIANISLISKSNNT